MVKVTSREIEHLGKISRIKIEDNEVAKLAAEIEAVLEYASSLEGVAVQSTLAQEEQPTENVMRDDVVIQEDRELFLDQAPEREGDYFVVPKIITKNQ